VKYVIVAEIAASRAEP